jgi:hypothetical protein
MTPVLRPVCMEVARRPGAHASFRRDPDGPVTRGDPRALAGIPIVVIVALSVRPFWRYNADHPPPGLLTPGVQHDKAKAPACAAAACALARSKKSPAGATSSPTLPGSGPGSPFFNVSAAWLVSIPV